MRLAAALGTAVLTVLLAAPAASAVPPFRPLGSFDRIATFYKSITPIDRITVTERESATQTKTTVFVDDATGPVVRFDAIAWAPGAASLAVNELFIPSNPQARNRIRIFEYPSGPVKTLDGVFDSVRSSTAFMRTISAMRWSGTGTPASVRLIANVSQAGFVSIKPDGTGIQVLNQEEANQTDPLRLPDGRRVYTAPTGFEGFRDIFVEGVGNQPDKQLTNTSTIEEYGLALSPDGKQIAYLRGESTDHAPQQRFTQPREEEFQHKSQLAIINVDGTNLRLSPDTSFSYRPPAWSPNGSRIAFLGLVQRSDGGFALVLMSIKSDGTDLGRHTPVFGDLSDPNPWPGSDKNPIRLDWGATCQTIQGCSANLSLVEQSPGVFAVISQPILVNTASIGFLVERYVRRRKLRRVGRVPFGTKRKGSRKVRWNTELKGRRLRRGRYRITLRALAAGNIPLDISKRVDLVVPRKGKPRLRRARVRR